MKLLEYEAKKHFRRYGILVPRGLIARDPEAGAFIQDGTGTAECKIKVLREAGVPVAVAPSSITGILDGILK